MLASITHMLVSHSAFYLLGQVTFSLIFSGSGEVVFANKTLQGHCTHGIELQWFSHA